MPIPFALGHAADLTNVAIQRIWLKASSIQKVTYFDKFFNVERWITDRLMRDSSITGLGEAARLPEQGIVVGEAPVQGYDQTYTQVEYGKLLSVTKQMWKFGIKKRDLESVTQELRNACLRKKETLCGDHIDNQSATSYTVSDDNGNYSRTISGGDGVAAASEAHTREDGGTNWNNEVYDGTTYNMDFDYDAIKAAHRTAALIRDGKGNLTDVNIDTLTVRKNFPNHFRALEILGAIRAGGTRSIPGESSNDAAGTPAFKVLPLPWINTNTGNWGMFDSGMKSLQYGFQLKESQPIQLEGPNVVFKTGEIQYKATEMYDLGFNDVRNHVFSDND